MLEAAQTEGLDVDRLSFTGCLRILAGAAAGVRQRDPGAAGAVVPAAAGRDGAGAHRAAPQPGQPARRQAQDVEVREEAPGASRPTTLEETLCRDSGYYLTSGIVLKGHPRSDAVKVRGVDPGYP